MCAHAEWEEERKHHAEARTIYQSFLKSEPATADGVEADNHVIRAGPKLNFTEETTAAPAEKAEGVSEVFAEARSSARCRVCTRGSAFAYSRTHRAYAICLVASLLRRGRQAFIAARKYAPLTYHAYVFAADIEFVVNNSVQFAAKIYQSGMDKFAAENGVSFLIISPSSLQPMTTRTCACSLSVW